MQDFLYRLIRPRHWLRNYPTSPAWDAFILRAIAAGDVRQIGGYTAKVGGKFVWVENYPYGYGRPYPGAVMPSARTVDLLAEALAVARNSTQPKEDLG